MISILMIVLMSTLSADVFSRCMSPNTNLPVYCLPVHLIAHLCAGILIVVAVGVALGVLLGGLLLIFVVVYMRR